MKLGDQLASALSLLAESKESVLKENRLEVGNNLGAGNGCLVLKLEAFELFVENLGDLRGFKEL